MRRATLQERAALAVVCGLALAPVGCKRAGQEPQHERDAKAPEKPPLPEALRSAPRRPLPPLEARYAAPDLEGVTGWINTTRPLSPEALRGRVVVFDFWTSACVNCLHTLPKLAELERRFAGEPFVVVGIHSPKFDAETERERLRSAVFEHGIAHPVAIDAQMAVWQRWGVRAWPTIVVVDAEGRVVFRKSGEPDEEELAGTVASALEEGYGRGVLAKGPIDGVSAERLAARPLSHPAKVVPLADSGLAISDTGQHRVIIVDKKGAVVETVGSGRAGARDGAFGEASFRRPVGVAEAEDGTLFVADTENHTIRKIDRRTKTVTTVAGTGRLGTKPLGGVRDGLQTALRTPWDVLYIPSRRTLFVALAGSHQVAAFDPKSGEIRLFAGSGEEARKDGRGEDAAFAQPSGLATDGRELFVADAETSSIRAVRLDDASVRTVVGQNLFVFGDVDGPKEVARLKHPLGVAFARGALFAADTYNNKIKRIDPKTGAVTTVFGGAREALFEPGGVASRGEELLVADSRNHRVVAWRSGAVGNEVRIDGLSPPVVGVDVAAGAAGAGQESAAGADVPHKDVVRIPAVAVAPPSARVHVSWALPEGTGVNEDAPFRVRWTTSDGLSRAPEDIKGKGAQVKSGFDVDVLPTTGADNARLGGTVDLVVCDVETHSVCVPIKRRIEMELSIEPQAPRSAKVSVPLPAAKP